jgi:uncharacterized protein (DUF1697 family)
MATYIALLRGINVGGKNMIRMSDLERILTAGGLVDVRTYIRSGNVLFRCDEEEAGAADRVHALIHEHLGLTVPVVVRSAAALEEVIAAQPYSAQELAAAQLDAGEAESRYVSFLSAAPDPARLARALELDASPDRLVVHNREVFLLLHQSIRLSKLAAKIEQLAPVVTTRNWNTVSTLAAMAHEMDGAA